MRQEAEAATDPDGALREVQLTSFSRANVCCRPLVHRLMRSLLNTTNGEASRLVRQIATRAGLTA